MKKTDITVSLVNYKTQDLLLKCIETLKKHTRNVSYEIIVLDNASEDDTILKIKKKFPEVITIQSKKNLYATRGNNKVFKRAKGEYFLVLNPDMEFSENVLFKMKDFLDKNKTVAAVSCRQYYKDKTQQNTASMFPTPLIEFWENNMLGRFFQNKKALENFRYVGWDRKSTRVVEMIPDTIMMIRTDVGRKLGLYDPKIKLMYMENDLCIRIKNLGYSVCHLGDVSILHHVGQSTKQIPSLELFKIYQEDRFYYYKKHFGILWGVFIFVTFQVNYLYYLFEPFINILRNKKTLPNASF